MKRSARLCPVLLLLGTGCTGEEAVSTLPALEGPPDWIVEVVRDPARFGALLDATGREGWVAFHANDPRRAVDAFTGTDPAARRARARAEWQLALLYGDLARATDKATHTFLASWQARDLATTPGLQTLAAQWRGCGGLDRLGAGADATKLPPLFHAEAGYAEALAARAAVHEEAKGGKLDPLYEKAVLPVVVEPAEGFERSFYDPCVYHTLSEAWWGRTFETLGTEDWKGAAAAWGGEAGLEGRLFAPWLTTADLEAELAVAGRPGVLGATQPSLAELGVPREASVQDDVEVARDDVRALDKALDERREALLASAGDDGAALLTDLGLQHRFRQEWIAARARKALYEDRPHQAMAYLELARDVSRREVGPSNTPSILALYAEAEIRLGRTREALDVLALLEQSHPEVKALSELTGDLAVLQGMDRQGDSKEN